LELLAAPCFQKNTQRIHTLEEEEKGREERGGGRASEGCFREERGGFVPADVRG